MADRLPCQVCGRALVPLSDGTSRSHTPRRRGCGGAEGAHCPGSGFRLARWLTGQVLQHHSGEIWEVVEDHVASPIYGLPGPDYLLRCLDTRKGSVDTRMGRETVCHCEYMHRHGWIPVPKMHYVLAGAKAFLDYCRRRSYNHHSPRIKRISQPEDVQGIGPDCTITIVDAAELTEDLAEAFEELRLKGLLP